jgi:riboflavin synthase
MFARYNMFTDAKTVLEDYTGQITYIRYTVPGIKDLPVAALKLFEEKNCDIVIALGMPGPKHYDKISAQVASEGIVNCQLQVKKHILEVFVHEDEGEGDDSKLKEIMKHRTIEHTKNAITLVLYPEKMQEFAGQGKRQGYSDALIIE